MGRLAWRLAACAAAMLAANVQASPGPQATQDVMLSSNPYTLAPVQSGPLSSLGATPSRNVYLPSGVVVDAHGRELAATRYNNPEPMNATTAARPGGVNPSAAESSHPGTTGGSPTEHPSVNNPDGTTPMPAPVPGIVPDVPEPSSFALMGVGLAGLAWAARRKVQRRR
jgi:hypothetical protein